MNGLRAEKLRVERGSHVAVRDASFAVEAGSWFGIIGANGSGKTSLLRAVAGRLPKRSGRIWIGEEQVEARAERARRIGFAPDNAMLPDALTAREILRIVAGDTDRALGSMGPLGPALGISTLLDRTIGGCSAGMRQRIAIACAFAEGQSIVILDEPFNWLDPLAAYDTRIALRALVDQGLTLVTALHDLGTLAGACDAGALLADGEVKLDLDRAALDAARRDPARFERDTIGYLRAQRG
ncbi:MAG: transporter ATP-binding protein [Alphaproteobacteria bacterium]|nr:transporter ATP-binding protein [Alphaproteobacteria bacterium]